MTRARDPASAVRNAISCRPGQVLVRDDDGCVSVRSLLDRRVLTHRLVGEERVSGVLRTGDDPVSSWGRLTSGCPLRGASSGAHGGPGTA